MKSFHRKRPEMRPGKVVFAWDNAPVHTSVSVRGFLAARDMKMLLYPPYYSLDLAPANFFLFPSVKRAHNPEPECPECLGTRAQAHVNGILCQGILEVARAPQKMYLDCWRLCQENLIKYIPP